MSDIYKTVYRNVIFQAIRDLAGASPVEKDAAIKYLHSNAFVQHCAVAEFPEGLQDALDEMLLMSRSEQKVVSKMLMDAITEELPA